MKAKRHIFSHEIMRAYDIRGTYGKNLNAVDAYFLGRAMAAIVMQDGLPNTFCVGRDGRISSPELHAALLEGLTHSGVSVVDIGVVATPTLYYGAVTQDGGLTAGIMITGSHNPGDQNGFKIIYEGKPFYGDRIQQIASVAKEGAFVDGTGSITTVDIRSDYIQRLCASAVGNVGRRLRIAWDSGNGATGELVEMLSSVIDAEHILLNTKIDGRFPNHHPDPTIPANMRQLIEVVKNQNCDVGLAFDGDGDRLGAIDNKGRMVFGDQILLVLAEDLLSRHPGAKVIADVKTSDVILNKIKGLGGQPIIWRTGHSLIKAKMREESALLAGEMSGHLFFGEDYYCFDDALFASCKLINILSNARRSLAEMIDALPKTFSTPELRLEVDEAHKFQIVEDVKAEIERLGVEYNDLDGVRVNEKSGWWLVRASNTQNALIIRVEGNTSADLHLLSDKVIGIFSTLGIDASIIKDAEHA